MAPRPNAKDKLRELSESAPYLLEGDRLLTFKPFTFDKIKGANCTSDKVAKAGFYRTDKTSGKCPFCLKELEFEEEDDPWIEHSSRKPNCAFVKLGKLDESTWTVGDTITLAITSITMAKWEQQMEMLHQWKKTANADAMVDGIASMTVKKETKPRITRNK